MDKFIHDENLKLYHKVLSETTDEDKRKSLLRLIRDEIAKDQKPKEHEERGRLSQHSPRR